MAGWVAIGEMRYPSECETCLRERTDWCSAFLAQPLRTSRCDSKKAWKSHRVVNAGERIVSNGEVSDGVLVIARGWGYRFLSLPDGRRQIINFLLPGDLLSVTSLFEKRFNCSADALTEVHIVELGREEIRSRIAGSAKLQEKWQEAIACQIASAEELLFVIGRGTSEERVANMILHLVRRITERMSVREGRYRLPVNLPHMADTVGLTPEHVCRMLTRFRKRGIFGLSKGCLEVFDFAALERAGHLSTMPMLASSS